MFEGYTGLTERLPNTSGIRRHLHTLTTPGGTEVQQDVLAFELSQRNLLVVNVRQREVRRGIAHRIADRGLALRRHRLAEREHNKSDKQGNDRLHGFSWQ